MSSSLEGTLLEEERLRPELIQLFDAPALTEEYLSLSPDRKDQLESFRKRYPKFMLGEGDGYPAFSLRSKPEIGEIAWKVRLKNQFLIVFDHYLENHQERYTFNRTYVRENKELRADLGTIGNCMINQALKIFGDVEDIVQLAACNRPEIMEHWKRQSWKRFSVDDAIDDLFKCLDYFLENRKEGESFNQHYLMEGGELNNELNNIGQNLRSNVKNNLPGGLPQLVGRAVKKRPELSDYWKVDSRERFYIKKGVTQLLQLFDHYLENDAGKEIFNTAYLCDNEPLNEKYDNLGQQLYDAARSNLKDEGGISRLIQLAARQRPEIDDHWNIKRKWDIQTAISELGQVFAFYLKNDVDIKTFNPSYFQSDKEVNGHLSNLAASLYDRANRNLEGGLHELVQIAAEKEPELLNHWECQRKRDSDFIVTNLLKIFDYFLANHHGKRKFNFRYLEKNQDVRKKFGLEGYRIYQYAYRHFGKGRTHMIVELAAEKRPEILEYWKGLG